jgi:hypothetical protein|tara:strand:- start:223 stop:414 length:192 start_codon:yes stop_codon:yes gene_type:complete
MELEVGDLVRINDKFDKKRQLGIVIAILQKVHLKSSGTAAVVMVYWPMLEDTDWEYTFFLEKI